MIKKLHLFLASGHTFTFQDVKIVHDNETAITFQYTAMSDGLTKRASFFKSTVAGISRTEE